MEINKDGIIYNFTQEKNELNDMFHQAIYLYHVGLIVWNEHNFYQ